MLARDIAQEFPAVDVDTEALTAARLLASHDLPGLVVLDSNGTPTAVLPAADVLRVVIPDYIQDDPSLARVVNEIAADQIMHELRDRTVRDLLPESPGGLPVIDGDDTLLEGAALMAQLRSPLVAVVDNHRFAGVVTAAHLLKLALGDA